MRPWATFIGDRVTIHGDSGIILTLTAEQAESLAADIVNAARYIRLVPEDKRLTFKGGK